MSLITARDVRARGILCAGMTKIGLFRQKLSMKNIIRLMAKFRCYGAIMNVFNNFGFSMISRGGHEGCRGEGCQIIFSKMKVC
jgi:hypothetical protein